MAVADAKSVPKVSTVTRTRWAANRVHVPKHAAISPKVARSLTGASVACASRAMSETFVTNATAATTAIRRQRMAFAMVASAMRPERCRTSVMQQAERVGVVRALADNDVISATRRGQLYRVVDVRCATIVP